MAKSFTAMTFSVRFDSETQTGEVRAPDGQLVCTTPTFKAHIAILGMMRLAEYGHKSLRNNPKLLHEVLTSYESVTTEAAL